MDGDDLSESEPSEPKSLGELFREVFPYYIAMGMTYDEFWYGDPTLARDYRKAQDIRLHQEEWARHRQGEYFMAALLAIAPVIKPFVKDPKPGNYPEEPWPLTEKEAREREIRKERENTLRFIQQLEAESERNLKQMKVEKEAVKDGREHDQQSVH